MGGVKGIKSSDFVSKRCVSISANVALFSQIPPNKLHITTEKSIKKGQRE